MKTLIIMMLLSYSAISGEISKSLSCSNKITGTRIFYINGVMNTDLQASDSASAILTTIKGEDFLDRIDHNGKIHLEHIHNSSEAYGLDFIQTVIQKIEETGQIPHIKTVATYLFRAGKFCVSQRLLCTSIGVALGDLLLKQAYSSETDTKKIANTIQLSLSNEYKVIMVSHSQGNLYANYVYNELLNRGVSAQTLNKYFGNLQIGTAVSSIRAKNKKVYLAKQDLIINTLRELFPTTMKANYSFEEFPDTMDVLRHGMVESYLNSEVKALGPKQGKRESVIRKSSDVFLENLEEVAWMLANNNDSCCEGRDGRFYRKDYDTDPEEGFLENTVATDKKLNLEIDKESQICGKVALKASQNNPNYKIKLVNSQIDSVGLTEVKGNVYLQNTEVIPTDANKTLKIEGTTNQPLTIQNSKITGTMNISGALVTDHVQFEGTGDIVGSLFHDPIGPIEWHSPGITNAKITGKSDFQGYYVIKRDLSDTTIVGTRIRNSSGGYDLTIIDYHSLPINKGIIKGFTFLQGRINDNVTIEGSEIVHAGNTSTAGINLSPTSTLKLNSNVQGAAYINHTNFSGTLNANALHPSGVFVTNFFDSTITSNISGYVQIFSSTINGGTISGNPVISDSMLTAPTVSCNASISNENVSGKTFGCGYVSETKLQKKMYVVDEIMQEMEEEKQTLISEWDSWMQNKQKEIRATF